MQQNKGIKNLSEIEKYTENGATLTYNRILTLFNLWGVSRMLNPVKERGVPPMTIFKTLVILAFFQIKNIYNLFLSPLQNQVAGSKNTYYRFMQNEWVRWRDIHYAFAKQFKQRTQQRTGEEKTLCSCLVVDDSPLEKTGKKIESSGTIHHHTNNNYIHGFKALFCGYWDGKSYIPLDFSLYQERGKNGMRGLSKAELKEQHSKGRSPDSPGQQRSEELRASKLDNSIRMVKRACQQGFMPDYVLADSWFISADFLRNIRLSSTMDRVHTLSG